MRRVRGAKGAISALIVSLALLVVHPLAGQTKPAPKPPQSVRLYVLDGGILESDPTRYQLAKEDVKVTQLSVAAYLIVHPKGLLMWDT